MHKFSPDNALRLERAERYELIPPEPTLRQLGLTAGMTLIDIGAGTGFFARAASSIVGPTGKVYAADMSIEMLAHFRHQGTPSNVEVIHSGEYDIPLPDASADMSFIAFVAHETPDLPRFLREVVRLTKPSGTIAIVEWKRQSEEHGPPEKERLDQHVLVDRLSALSLVCQTADLNSSHYSVVARRSSP
jgi:ubiquinone/menaquinone biosynthesis C-methylase UbiE